MHAKKYGIYFRLQRFEKTNEMLLNCNALSNGRLKAANDDFKKHIKLINDMKKDLDHIFKKIRNIKSRIGVQYPQAMKKVEQKLKTSSLSEESKEEEEDLSPNANEPQCSNVATVSGKKTKDEKHVERKLSKDCVTVNYVQMETNAENGVCTNSDGRIESDTVIPAVDGKTDNDSTDNESSDTSDT